MNNKKKNAAAEKSIDVRSNTTMMTKARSSKNVSTRKSYFINKKQRREEKSTLELADP